jgi:hypothetical protein
MFAWRTISQIGIVNTARGGAGGDQKESGQFGEAVGIPVFPGPFGIGEQTRFIGIDNWLRI